MLSRQAEKPNLQGSLRRCVMRRHVDDGPRHQRHDLRAHSGDFLEMFSMLYRKLALAQDLLLVFQTFR